MENLKNTREIIWCGLAIAVMGLIYMPYTSLTALRETGKPDVFYGLFLMEVIIAFWGVFISFRKEAICRSKMRIANVLKIIIGVIGIYIGYHLDTLRGNWTIDYIGGACVAMVVISTAQLMFIRMELKSLITIEDFSEEYAALQYRDCFLQFIIISICGLILNEIGGFFGYIMPVCGLLYCLKLFTFLKDELDMQQVDTYSKRVKIYLYVEVILLVLLIGIYTGIQVLGINSMKIAVNICFVAIVILSFMFRRTIQK